MTKPLQDIGILLAVAAIYAVACVSPTVYFDNGGTVCTGMRFGTPIGWMALLFGWIPPFTVAWAANPVFLVALVLFGVRKYTAASVAAGVAVALAATTPLLLFVGARGLEVGYVLWQSSFIVLLLGSLWSRRRDNSTTQDAVDMDALE